MTALALYMGYTGATGRELVWKTGPGIIGSVSRFLAPAFTDDVGRWLLVGVGLVILVLAWGPTAFANARGLGRTAPLPQPPAAATAETVKTADRPPGELSLEETSQLAEQFSKTSKAIYAFLNKQAERTDEAKVVAEYRLRFDAKVVNLCLDLVAAGLATAEELKNAMKPPSSVDDIQWIARVLALTGEGYSAKRLAKYQAQAMKKLKLEPMDTAAKEKELEELEELVPFVNEAKSFGVDMTPLAALERWMERERIPEPRRRRMRETTERLLKEIQEDAP